MVVVVNVIVRASFELRNAVKLGKMEKFCFERAEEALDRFIVKAVPFAAHALRDAVAGKHCPIWLHLVLPALVGVHDQPDGILKPGKRRLKRALNQLEHGAPRHTVRDDLAVVQIHAG